MTCLPGQELANVEKDLDLLEKIWGLVKEWQTLYYGWKDGAFTDIKVCGWVGGVKAAAGFALCSICVYITVCALSLQHLQCVCGGTQDAAARCSCRNHPHTPLSSVCALGQFGLTPALMSHPPAPSSRWTRWRRLRFAAARA